MYGINLMFDSCQAEAVTKNLNEDKEFDGENDNEELSSLVEQLDDMEESEALADVNEVADSYASTYDMLSQHSCNSESTLILPAHIK